MDMDSFDPSSLLQLEMEEHDGSEKVEINFEGIEGNRNESGNNENEVINLDPDNDSELITSGKMVSDNALTYVEPNTNEPVTPGNENDPGGIQAGQEDLGLNSMCSVPISMFHLFNLENQPYEEEGESSVAKEGERHEGPGVEIAQKKHENTVKKLLPVTYGEKTFRKNLIKNGADSIKLFKLNCTVCSKHIGLALNSIERLLRVHRDLNVMLCRNCYDFYGNKNFPIEEGSEIYCEWCGQGGMIFCCSNCPKVFCESCITLNFGIDRRNQIESVSTWSCFVCNPSELWPHRTICWAVQRHMREARSKIPQLEGEERQRFINMDISECCSKSSASGTNQIPLPPLPQLQKIPLCLFANRHSKMISNVLKDNRQSSTVRNNQSVYIRKGKVNNQMQRTSQAPCPPQIQNGVITPGQDRLQLLLQGVSSANYSKAPVEIINVDDDNDSRPMMLQRFVDLDLKWLQTAVKESSHCLFKFQSLLNQFDLLSGKLKTDIQQVNEFTDKLHSLFKITISTLAKIDNTMLQDLKNCTAPKIRNYANVTIMKKPETPKLELPKPKNVDVVLKTPAVPSKVPVTAPNSSTVPETADEVDLNCLLFCETVLTEAGDGNKENECNVNNNFIQKDSRLNTAPVARPVANSRKRNLNQTKSHTPSQIPTIVLDDDEPPQKYVKLTPAKYNFYFKKFKLKSCKVLLSRCDKVV